MRIGKLAGKTIVRYFKFSHRLNKRLLSVPTKSYPGNIIPISTKAQQPKSG
jgi:hypothetical protein